MIRFIAIFLILFFQNNILLSDPFTNDIGLIKKEEIVEAPVEEVTEIEEEIVEQTEDLIELAEEIFEPEVTDVPEIEEENDKSQELITVLNIDPIIAYSLKDYTLKGTALSNTSKHKFKRARVKKFDQAKIPTTHTILENETIEKIAFRYGFSLREIEIANAIYPGSRELVTGDKIVIPNRYHIVKEGQSLTAVADRYKIDPVQLATYNDISDDDILLIGDKLLLPFFIHVTDLNETLSDIAGRYERETSELIEFNSFDQDTLVISENQLIKIPIYANRNIDYENLSKKSINDYEIDNKNLAIIEISSGQFMVREGDRIGNKDGIIVSIETNKMIVLEENIEYEFLINTPIVGQAVASLPGEVQQTAINDINNNQNPSETTETLADAENSESSETITNVEDLFN